jgi:hypothetical protein
MTLTSDALACRHELDPNRCESFALDDFWSVGIIIADPQDRIHSP